VSENKVKTKKEVKKSPMELTSAIVMYGMILEGGKYTSFYS
jgi:hypothetical protein